MRRKSRLLRTTLCVAAVIAAGAAGASGGPETELPSEGAPIIRIDSQNRPVSEALQVISDATKWQIFCTQEAGRKQFVMYAQDMLAGDLLRSIVRSQGLMYRVEGTAVYVMTLDEYNEAYGATKAVFHLKHAPADKVAAALTPLLASSKSGRVAALSEANAVVVYDTQANLAALGEVVEQIDRPLETAVVQLENASADQVQNALTRFVSPMGAISAEVQSNQVVIRESEGRLAALVEIAQKMDLPSTKVTREFRLKNAECSTVAAHLAEMFGLRTAASAETVVRGSTQRSQPAEPAGDAQGQAQQQQPQPSQPEAAPQQPRRRSSAERRFLRRELGRESTESQTGAAMGTVVADLRTNSVWVTDTPNRIDEIAAVIEGFDTALATRTYRFNYADPSELGLDEKLAGVLLSPFDHYEVDQRTRTVSVTTTEERMAVIMDRLREWDIEPMQVFITGKVLAVNRDRLLDIGASYDALIHNLDENISTEIEVSGSFLPVIPATPKGSLRFGNITNDDFTALIEAIESDSTARVLSSPRVLVKDGSQAQLFVATEEPYTEVTIDGNTNTTVENIEFKNVGVTIQVAVTITGDNKISMAILLEVSSLQEIRAGIPVVSTSQMTSDVIVANGRPLIIGGLISDQDVNTVDKVPILGDIPLLGMLFRNTRKDRSQRELVLVVVPSIISPNVRAEVPTLGQIEDHLEGETYLQGDDSFAPAATGGGQDGEKGAEGDDASASQK